MVANREAVVSVAGRPGQDGVAVWREALWDPAGWEGGWEGVAVLEGERERERWEWRNRRTSLSWRARTRLSDRVRAASRVV